MLKVIKSYELIRSVFKEMIRGNIYKEKEVATFGLVFIDHFCLILSRDLARLLIITSLP